ncbi:MAG: fluoride efflux transporter CrcB [Chloroflexota bacterium]
MNVVLIGLGGFTGAIARYAIDGWVTALGRGAFPWGTLVINVSGSLVLGLLFALGTERAVIPQELRSPLMIGFIGAYTTFSTLALESWRLLEDGAWLLGAVNLGGSIALGLVAVLAGVLIGRAI